MKYTPLGKYKNRTIYFNFETKKLAYARETSPPKNLDNHALLGLYLITFPLIKIVNQSFYVDNILTRIMLLLATALAGTYIAMRYNKVQFNHLNFYPFEIDAEQFEAFYRENSRELGVVIGTVALSSLSGIFAAVTYIMWGYFLALFVFTLMFFVCILLFTNKIHLRWKILKDLRKTYQER